MKYQSVYIGKFNGYGKQVAICFSFILFFLLLVNNGFAGTTRYVDPASSNPGGGYTSWSTAAHTVKEGLEAMSGGDTLILRDGIYTGYNNMVGVTYNVPPSADIPSGTPGNYTTVRAETDFMVIIDAESSYRRRPCHVYGSYIIFQGIECRNAGEMGQEGAGSPLYVQGSYIKLLRVGAVDSGKEIIHGNSSSVLNLQNTSYVLVEDCYAFGWGRYTIKQYGAENTIIRRCVGRKDGWAGGVGDIFTNYKSDNTEYQNNIAMDFDEPRHWHSGSGTTWGGYNINGGEGVAYRGNIAMNILGTNGQIMRGYEGNLVGTAYNPAFRLGNKAHVENNLVLNSTCGVMSYLDNTIINNTFIDIIKDDDLDHRGGGLCYSRENKPVATNNLLVRNQYRAAKDISTASDYNVFYGNAQNYYRSDVGVNDYSSENGNEINPLWSESNPNGGLKYPVRIEPNSNISGIGKNGADVGANIMTRIGVSGTLYGEPGYKDDTGVPLWPWKHEDIIKERMRAYLHWDEFDAIDPGNPDNPDTYITGKRGFAADGISSLYGGPVTLTSYIWEYLGNACPAEICNYNYVADNDAPTVPGNLVATAVSSSRINLSWSASTDNIDVSGYKIYRDGTQVGTSASTNYSDTGLNPSTLYSYTVSTYDMAGNESAQSASDSATTQASAPGPDVEDPTVPGGLSATAASSSQINLSWNASTDNVGVTGYKINRYGVQVGTSASTSYSDAGLNPSTLYSYTVSAYDAAGNESVESAADSATTQDAAPGPDLEDPTVPAGLSTASISSMQINIGWNASSDNVGVIGYKIYRDGVQIDTATSTNYSNTGLSPSTIYSYTVSAYDAAGNASTHSSSASAATKPSGSSFTTTIIENGSTWKYLKGLSDPQPEWNELFFDDTSWQEGPTGIGYGDNDDITVLSDMRNNYLSVYTRKVFTISNPSIITSMTLAIDYDDGFIAYINGNEVARINMPGGTPHYNTQSSSGREAGTSVDIDLSSYINFLLVGTNVLAIEIHNISISSSDLSFIPELLMIDEGSSLAPSPPRGLTIE